MHKPFQSVTENQRANIPHTDSHFSDPFWQSKTIQEIALAQGVQPIKNFDVLLGGWPEDELDDHFEEAVERWRHGELSG
jgi:hypothetical protein